MLFHWTFSDSIKSLCRLNRHWMPLGQFCDPVKVAVSLCNKTLWDKRIPNWVETLVYNCLIPFCLIQEKERATQTARVSSVIFTDEIEWHGVEYSGWFRWMRRLGSSSIVFFLYCHRWDKRARGFCCLRVSNVPISAQNGQLSAQTKPPSQVTTFIEP